ncbi:hypothetical protein Nepgr_012104 [Nepenthes gracilis]|uniref:Uncharacterized protein n=1 Tax=Nepenthes gracilis TaxID=150966 RepID=A0AAD3SFC9_NEPGR|nr:hypothetical protein Nepgr_012104 [Nepenthes gracilis]
MPESCHADLMSWPSDGLLLNHGNALAEGITQVALCPHAVAGKVQPVQRKRGRPGKYDSTEEASAAKRGASRSLCKPALAKKSIIRYSVLRFPRRPRSHNWSLSNSGNLYSLEDHQPPAQIFLPALTTPYKASFRLLLQPSHHGDDGNIYSRMKYLFLEHAKLCYIYWFKIQYLQ